MSALVFIIVSRSHAFFLVVPVRSSLHVLVVVADISYFQHWTEETGKENGAKEMANMQ